MTRISLINTGAAANIEAFSAGRGNVSFQTETGITNDESEGVIASSGNVSERTPEEVLEEMFNSGWERRRPSLISEIATRARDVVGSVERAIVSIKTLIDPLFLPIPALAGVPAGMSPGMMSYVLMMDGSGGGSASELGELLQRVPGYAGFVPAEDLSNLGVRLDELGPTADRPTVGVTLSDKTSYIFRAEGDILSNIVDVLPAGETVTVINNFPTKIYIGRVIKLGPHVVSVEAMKRDMRSFEPKKVTLFIKTRNLASGKVSTSTLSFPAADLKGLKSIGTTLVIGNVRIKAKYNEERELTSFVATLLSKAGFAADSLIIPVSVLDDNTVDGVEELGPAILDQGGSSVISIVPRLVVAGMWDVEARVRDIFTMFEHPDDKARFMKLTEITLEQAVDLLRTDETEFFKAIGKVFRHVFSMFISLADYMEDDSFQPSELFSTPENIAAADSGARVLKKLIAIEKRNPWIIAGLEGPNAEEFRAEMGVRIRNHYEAAKTGLAIYQAWREPYPGANPDGTVNLHGGLPLGELFGKLFASLLAGSSARVAPAATQAEASSVQSLPEVEISSPSDPFTELAREETIRPRLKLIHEMAGALMAGGEETWQRLGAFTMADGEPMAVAVVGYRSFTGEVRQQAARQLIGLIDNFISGSELDFAIVQGLGMGHISAINGASKIGTVMAGFPKGEGELKPINDRLEAFGWRAGVGRIGGRLAVMAVKAEMKEPPKGAFAAVSLGLGQAPARKAVVLPKAGTPDLASGRSGSNTSAGIKVGGAAAVAFAPTLDRLSPTGEEAAQRDAVEGAGSIKDIISPRSPQFRGVLDGPALGKILKHTPNADEAMDELAGLVYKVVFLQGLTVGEEMQSRIDVVAGMAREMDGRSGAPVTVDSYEDAHARLFAEAFDSVIAAASVPEQRRYAIKLTEFILGSGRDLSDVLYAASLFSGKTYLIGDTLGLPVIAHPTKEQMEMVKRFNAVMTSSLQSGRIESLASARSDLEGENPLLYRLAEARILRNAASPAVRKRMKALLQQAFEFLKANLR